MSGTYTETLEEHQYVLVKVTVTGAADEVTARQLAIDYGALDAGLYGGASLGDVRVEIERTIEDSDTEPNDDGEWEDDDEA